MPARYVAKNIVAAGLADRCEIQVSYAIGVAEPTSITVDTFGTGKVGQRQARRAGARALRPAPLRHPQDARPGAPDLPDDRGLRPLRPRAVHMTYSGRKRSAASASRRARPSPPSAGKRPTRRRRCAKDAGSEGHGLGARRLGKASTAEFAPSLGSGRRVIARPCLRSAATDRLSPGSGHRVYPTALAEPRDVSFRRALQRIHFRRLSDSSRSNERIVDERCRDLRQAGPGLTSSPTSRWPTGAARKCSSPRPRCPA